MNLNERIRYLRQKNKLTSKEFGNIFNVAESTVSLYENDRRTPNKDLIIKIAAHFNVSTDYLLGTTDVLQPIYKLESSYDSNIDIAKKLQILLDLIKNSNDIIFDDKSVDKKIKIFIEKSIQNIIETTRSMSKDEANCQKIYTKESE